MNNAKIASKNIISGIIRVVVMIFLPFVLRTALIYSLGSEYLGLSSLFTSILSVLNLAELGFSNAIIYCMYKPIAVGDVDKVNALLAFYKKIYSIIGIIVLAVGGIVTPFITFFIHGSWPSDINIYLLFIIYLANASVSYFFFAYKMALLNALKRVDIVNVSQIIVYVVQYLIQILVLLLFRNYYLYIIFTPICTIALNLLIEFRTRKQFPDYFCSGQIDRSERIEIINKVKSVFLYRLSEVTRNSLDTIVVSAFLGLVSAAIYNNYFYIFSAAYSIMVVLNQSVQAIVGGNIVLKSKKENFDDMRKYNALIMGIVSVFSVCLACLIQQFMSIWVGNDMQLSNVDALLFSMYFYILNMNNVKNLYFDGKGLWDKARWTFVLEIIGNILLNILLGKLFGTTGIIVATIITIFFFSFLCRTNLLFSEYFNLSAWPFYKDHICYCLVTIICMLLSAYACHIFAFGNVYIQLLVNACICCIIPGIIWLALLWKKYIKH